MPCVETVAAPPPRPSPAAALQTRFKHILQHQMAGLPMLNPAVQVQALGFRHWQAHWLGVLVTPWFMNLMLFPRLAAQWQTVGERQSRHYDFPAGVFEFIASRDTELGDYQSCSLFSPMFEFEDHAAACATAVAALAALFDAALRPHSDAAGSVATAYAPTPLPPASPRTPGKRDFLFGGSVRSPHEP